MAEAEVKEHKAEGSMATVKAMQLLNNYHRSDTAFEWLPDKVQALKDLYKVDGFQSTFEVILDKQGRYRLAGGGHHRKKALQELIEAEEGHLVRGLFKDPDGDWCIKVVKKSYTKAECLRNFVIENADAWHIDSDQNVYMQTVQIKAVLDGIMQESDNLEEFLEKIPNSATPIQMDERSFTRAKNAGVGAKTIQQYVGAWSHSRIQMAVQLINETGEAGEKLRELAKSLPSITMAYKFRNLMTDTDPEDGAKVRSSAADMNKAEKIIEREAYTRKDLEDIDTFKKEKELSPLDAIEQFGTLKKEERKAAKTPGTPKDPAQTVTKVAPAEAFMESLKHTLNTLKLGVDDLSKAQFTQAKDIFKDVAGLLKEVEARFGGNGKGKKAKK